jgi:hypothetical protein
MSSKLRNSLLPFLFLCSIGNVCSIVADESTLVEDVNRYYSEIDELFSKIADAGALRSTNLNTAERFFIREMRKNPAFYSFLRTNSKGTVISEIIRSENVERPMKDIHNERWFKVANDKKEPYYSLVKDDERGRYYLFWARPILKQGDRCVGTVLLKIDLWDSFYEFSNSMYIPFLVKLGHKSLFSHKWDNGKIGSEEQIAVPGVEKISINFSPPVKQAVLPDTTVAKKDTLVKNAVFSVGDSLKNQAVKQDKKNGTSGVLVFFIIILILGIAIVSAMLIAWIRKRALLRHIDEDDSI